MAFILEKLPLYMIGRKTCVFILSIVSLLFDFCWPNLRTQNDTSIRRMKPKNDKTFCEYKTTTVNRIHNVYITSNKLYPENNLKDNKIVSREVHIYKCDKFSSNHINHNRNSWDHGLKVSPLSQQKEKKNRRKKWIKIQILSSYHILNAKVQRNH